MVFATLEDNQKRMWFSTENGLTRIDPSTGIVELFDENNGLAFSNFSENTAIALNNGQLAFGGTMGIITVDPDKLTDLTYNTPLEFTNLYLSNKLVSATQLNSPLKQSIDHTSQIILKHFQSGFSIEFAALDFQNPQQTQYAYRLKGFEEEWVHLGNRNRATYTNLRPGKYLFEVRWTNRNGQWHTTSKTLSIHILPPWYRTIWAYLLFGTLLSALIVGISIVLAKMNDYKRDLLVEKKINLLKLQFFTNVSHEIRTPLTLIIGPIEDLLLSSELTDKVKTQLRIINKNARRMLMLTNQLLDFRKVQNNKMILNIKEIDIIAFTHDIFTSFQPLATHKHIEYQFSTTIDASKVWVDTSKIDIIVYNLLSNALKFTDPGKRVNLHISESTDLDNILIKVSDQGRGIPTENLSDLFTRYTILSNNELSGTGIGLSLSFELAKLHGGDIKVASELKAGSEFTLVIPKGKEHFKHNTQINIIDTPESQTTHNELHEELIGIDDDKANSHDTNRKVLDTILIVEDNHEILNYISNSLKAQYNCILADNGADAIAIANANQPSLILTDLMMPGMSGIELTRQIKANFQTSHIPIVMLTAKADMDDQITGIEIGAEAYITKPFRTDHLKTVVQNILIQRKNIVRNLTQSNPASQISIDINSKDEAFLNKLTSFIEENFDKDIVIDQLAEHCCLSRTVFYTKLKSLTGLSPIEFVRQFKLKIAATLLEKGYNVSEVAFKIGFNDVKYFSRQFKSLYGHPPSQHVKS
jgi:signal transduction histidine kinase/DNA-binding NarL/FixJ family response regulator